MKFALISNILPPSSSAHSAIIHRLLRDLDPESYCLLSTRDYASVTEANFSGRLPSRYYHLPPTYQLTRGYRFGLQALRKHINLALAVALRGRMIARIARKERCNAVIVCTGGQDIVDFPAAYLASRMIGIRFFPYLLDQYSHMVSYVLGDSFLRHFEGRILRKASAVIVPNEFLRDDLKRRFDVDAVVIHNMCDLSVYDVPLTDQTGDGNHEIKIVYTGGVGPLHYSAFRNMLAALELLKRKDVRLHLYTAQPRDDIEREGLISQHVVYHEHEPVSAMPDIQRRADILFLALAIDSQHPEIVRTAMPGKMAEYLAAGRPILVQAPSDSFIASYFRQHDCGLVVDQNDPAQLAHAMESILNDPALGERLGKKARERAKVDFDHVKERARFIDLLQVAR